MPMFILKKKQPKNRREKNVTVLKYFVGDCFTLNGNCSLILDTVGLVGQKFGNICRVTNKGTFLTFAGNDKGTFARPPSPSSH